MIALRRYFKKFSGAETRYIYVEITLRNLHFTNNWQCELFTKFYNDARELKGQVVRLHRVEKTDDLIRLTAGWGSNVEGSWRKDRYTAELIFMDRKEKGFEEKEEINVHSVFIGNPGTGKTTVAKMMGKLYKKMGLLTKGEAYSS